MIFKVATKILNVILCPGGNGTFQSVAISHVLCLLEISTIHLRENESEQVK